MQPCVKRAAWWAASRVEASHSSAMLGIHSALPVAPARAMPSRGRIYRPAAAREMARDRGQLCSLTRGDPFGMVGALATFSDVILDEVAR